MRRLSVLRLTSLAATSATECVSNSSSGIRLTSTSPISSLIANNGNQALLPLFNLRSFSSLPPHTELQMPALSPTMSMGNLLEWKVTEGQEITAGDLLAEVETDKATIGWENQDDGFVAKLLVPAGTKDIPVGSPVVILVDDADQVAAFKDYQPQGTAAATSGDSKSSTAASETPAAASKDVGTTSVTANQRIGPAARTLLQQAGLSAASIIPTGPHDIITKGDVLAAIAGGPLQTISTPSSSTAAAATTTTPPAAVNKQEPSTPPAAAVASPAQQQAPKPTTNTAPTAPSISTTDTYTDIPTTTIRRIIASRLLESKSTIPHLYVTADVNMDNITKLREALKQQGSKVSVNDFVIKAAAMALRDTPAANAMWDTSTETIKGLPSVDISIAVATEAGLITPIVKTADTKSLSQISADVRELAGRARANKLLPEEFMGGSFSISNLGMFGVDSFFAIINPPQACIMAVGGGRKEARMVGGKLESTNVMTVTLSADHRVFDGEVAADLLKAFSSYMENPFKLVTI